MRKFVIAIIVAVFMAGCAQPVVKEEVKPAVPPVVKPAVPPAVPPAAVVNPASYALSKEDFEKCGRFTSTDAQAAMEFYEKEPLEQR